MSEQATRVPSKNIIVPKLYSLFNTTFMQQLWCSDVAINPRWTCCCCWVALSQIDSGRGLWKKRTGPNYAVPFSCLKLRIFM